MNPYAVFESERRYYYPTEYGIEEVIIEQAKELRVSESGHHYITTASGLKVIMPPGWIRITITPLS